MMWLVLFAVLSGGWCHQLVIAGKYPVGPNHYLGTCLDSAWVTQMETEMGVSSKARDSSGRLINPFLQPALKYPRYTVDDPRTSLGKAFSDSCMPKDNVFYGADQDTDGNNRGNVNGTLVLDVGDWDTHWLSSFVVAIFAEEVVGYKVSISVGGASADVTQRMSSARTGVCTPTHFNAEVWSSEIPAYFCFIGYGGVNKYAADAAANGKPVLFYHYEPDLFHIRHKGEFDRVFLPRTDPERVKLLTGGYGEHGYGDKTDNPVNVDYPSLQLTKFAASIVKNLPAGSLLSKITLADTDINSLMTEYVTVSNDVAEPSPYFRAACNWVKENYIT
ncbi:hypothetical protein PI125_g13512 [Phytophthora idaei]|nr:hypothetical protein PI125_g13512 [Phytophthora idaei]KAG3148360.1 hypothetical protein PI126_g12473 [Phytophthora idaei]